MIVIASLVSVGGLAMMGCLMFNRPSTEARTQA